MKILCLLLMCLLLAGCAAKETFETLDDVYGEQSLQEPQKVSYQLPEGAALQTMRSDYGQLFFCDGYEITVQTMASGDIDATIRELTGYDMEELTVLKTGTTGNTRYECVWTSAGEGGDAVGRTVILDDGKFHYCMSVMAQEEEAASLKDTWQALFDSFTLG